MDSYQRYIAISKYARFLPEEGRRETWEETVHRYCAFFHTRYPDLFDYNEIFYAISTLEVMPSMRSLMAAGKALNRTEIAGYNPVVGDTLVLTKEFGLTPIKNLVSIDATVVNKNGEWSDAHFTSYGKQKIYRVSVRKNCSNIVTIDCTANHRWVLKNGEVVSTETLKPKMQIPFAAPPRPSIDSIDYKLGVIHGLVYGDGTATYMQERQKGYHIRLCGDAVECLSFFEDHGKICYPPSCNGEPVVMLYGALSKTHSLKTLPDPNETDAYLVGFVRGWIATDGNVTGPYSQCSICMTQNGIDWMDAVGSRLGYVKQNIVKGPTETNFRKRNYTVYNFMFDRASLTPEDFLIKSKRERFISLKNPHFTIVSVEDLNIEDEVFCAEVPDTNTFTLQKGIVTGNCSYVAFDDVRAFDELLYISMCSTGVGFSVERQFISKLPEICGTFRNSEHTIVVEDSKEGWGAAFRELIHLLYAGIVPKWDLSKLRPKGAVLKTFGGRSSGPEPLNQLFQFCVATFKNAAGRRLESIEVHDIACVTGMIVMSGGVRRSALISLSNLSDLRMRDAKNGQFWLNTPHRSMSNNSVAYTEKPELKQFLDEFTNLYTSGSGERGIFNRYGSIRKGAGLVDYEGNLRPRTLEHDVGANPCCVTGDTQVLTDEGYKPVSSLVGKPFTAIVHGKPYKSLKGFWSNGVKPIVKLALLNNQELKCTPDHKILISILKPDSNGWVIEENQFWVEAQNLFVGSNVIIGTNPVEIDLFDNFYQTSKVVSIVEYGKEEVFDCTIEDVHRFNANNIIVHNCEITLRNGGFCNLSEIVVRPDDTLSNLERKITIASTIGTFQSTLTDFPYIRTVWKQNAEEERLLGVSLTGIMDHPILSTVSSNAIEWLNKLRNTAQYTNSIWAKKLGIPESKAITCVKPSGTVSQLVNSASGMHPRFSDYYIRTVRGDYKDPVSQWMIERGVPHETDLMNSNNVVFSFPIASPRGSKTVKHVTALQQLNHWKMYAEHYVEHNPSITVYYKDEEFLDVMAWVHKNFDICNGLSFLPFSNHPYPQAPYQEIDETKYNLAKSQFPELDWSTFKVNEYEDNTTASQEFACIGGQCEI